MENPNHIATVGHLRAALEGIPDHAPIVVNAADPDYPKEAVTEQVITSTGFGLVDWGDGRGLQPDNVFGLNCHFPMDIEDVRRTPISPAPQVAPATAAEPEAGS